MNASSAVLKINFEEPKPFWLRRFPFWERKGTNLKFRVPSAFEIFYFLFSSPSFGWLSKAGAKVSAHFPECQVDFKKIYKKVLPRL